SSANARASSISWRAYVFRAIWPSESMQRVTTFSSQWKSLLGVIPFPFRQNEPLEGLHATIHPFIRRYCRVLCSYYWDFFGGGAPLDDDVRSFQDDDNHGHRGGIALGQSACHPHNQRFSQRGRCAGRLADGND